MRGESEREREREEERKKKKKERERDPDASVLPTSAGLGAHVKLGHSLGQRARHVSIALADRILHSLCLEFLKTF